MMEKMLKNTKVSGIIFNHKDTNAQGMMGASQTASKSDDGHTAREEAEGKELWEKECRNASQTRLYPKI